MVLQTTLAMGLGRVLPSELPQLGPFSIEMGNVQSLTLVSYAAFRIHGVCEPVFSFLFKGCTCIYVYLCAYSTKKDFCFVQGIQRWIVNDMETGNKAHISNSEGN